MKRLTMSPQKSMPVLRNIVILTGLALFVLTGCNTTAGFGQDMQSVGRNIQNSANKNNK